MSEEEKRFSKGLQELLDLYNKEKEVTSLQDKILKLLIGDMKLEGYFKDMKYESVIEYYKRRKDLWVKKK